MGDNRYSKYYLGLKISGIKVAFATMLLSSVCFSNIAFGALSISGDDILASLKSGSTHLTYEGTYDVGIPVPGEAFDQSITYFDETWLKSSLDMTFQGDVAFYDAIYSQYEDHDKDGWKQQFDGGVINNSGTVNFVGSSITFGPVGEDENKDGSADLGNVIYAIADRREKKEEPLEIDARGGAVYNTGVFETSQITKAVFKGNAVYAGSLGYKNDKEYYHNHTHSHGGGMYNAKTAVFGSDAVFEGNLVTQLFPYAFGLELENINDSLESWGGGYFNADRATTQFLGKTVFKDNMAQMATNTLGGAIFNGLGSQLIFKGTVEFDSNSVLTDSVRAKGGAVYNEGGTVVFDGNAVFKNNMANLQAAFSNEDWHAGQILAGAGLYTASGNGERGAVLFNERADFKENKLINDNKDAVAFGGGAYVSNTDLTFNKHATFSNNTITSTGRDAYGSGAGLYTAVKGLTTFNNTVTFENNKIDAPAFAAGAGISNYGNVVFNAASGEGVTNILFIGNTAHNTQSDTDSNIPLEKVEYIQARGGAIYNGQGSVIFGKGTAVRFEQNKVTTQNAKAYGGAVYNDVYDANVAEQGRMEFSGDVDFFSNKADTGGGAIFNKGQMVLNGNLLFKGNEADKGGAIYNDTGALLTVSGDKVEFKNNIAKIGSNIYNLGTLNIQAVKDTMEIDYTKDTYPTDAHTLFDQTGDVYNAGTINIIDSALQLHTGLNTKSQNKTGDINVISSDVDLGKSTLYTGNFTVNNGSKIVTHIDDNAYGKVVAGQKININPSNTKLQVIVGLDEIAKGETKEYQFFKVEPDASTATTLAENETGVEGAFTSIVDNQLYTITEKEGEKGVYEVRRKTAEDMAITPVAPVNPNCTNGTCSNYNQEASDAWLESKIEDNESAAEIQGLLNEIAQEKGLHSDAYEELMQAITPDSSTLITAHANELTRQVSNVLDKRFYSSMERTHFTYNGKIHYKAPRNQPNIWAEAIYAQSEYDGKQKWDLDTAGVALGAEMPVLKDLKVGAMYAYSTGDGSVGIRDTEVESHMGAVYAEYSPSRFYVNGFALYGRSTVEENR